ncbi:MAG TPA: FAD-dependent oxidoreductase [Candidatus Binataceae bacterium]|nr:FAD-dependent oxidoreductase [Candidatus Binataceae bacterium]
MTILTRGAVAKPGTSLDFKTGDWRLERPVHAHRSAPCHTGCPAGEDPQGYLARLAEGDPKAAWETLVEANPLPAITGRVCHHPCEAACNRGQYDEPLAIHGVERTLGDQAIAGGWHYPLRAPASGAARVAVVGAGPAGLSAAYQLIRLGYLVTLFEGESEAGGLLASAIPSYRLPRAVLRGELERLLSIGMTFMPRNRLGRDFMLDELRPDHRAIFLGVGNQRGRDWSVDGVVPRDSRPGLDILKEWLSIGSLPAYKSVAIIGGGNTAVDLARVLRFSGIPEVHIISYRAVPGPGVPVEDAMRATAREVHQALDEGVIIHEHRGVRRLIIRGERVAGVEMVHTKKLTRAAGRRETVEFEGTETIMHVEQVIPAVGQEVDPTGLEMLLRGHPFLHPDQWGRLENFDGIFAGGDVREGAATVSEAIGDGRRAAIAIDRYLRGAAMPALESNEVRFADLNANYFEHQPRAAIGMLAVAERNAEREIEQPLSLGQIETESRRCFSCGECMACDNCWTLCPDNAVLKTREIAAGGDHYVFDYDYCKGCGLCAHECPVGYIAMQPER